MDKELISIQKFLKRYPNIEIKFKEKEYIPVSGIFRQVSTETLYKALEYRYSNVCIDYGSKVKHGKVVKLITNTHCLFTIVIFEHGNIFVTDPKLDDVVNTYVKEKELAIHMKQS